MYWACSWVAARKCVALEVQKTGLVRGGVHTVVGFIGGFGVLFRVLTSLQVSPTPLQVSNPWTDFGHRDQERAGATMDHLSTQCLIDAWSAVRTQQQWGLGCPTNGWPAGTPRLQTLDLTKCWKITCNDASDETFADIAAELSSDLV